VSGANPHRDPAPAGARLRAHAARALARIVFDGVSLRTVATEAASLVTDPRDRALLSGTLFAATRWWLRFDAALARMVARPWSGKLHEVRALLVVGLAQIETLGLPDYAVVGACVDATRTLGHPRHAGLVNAVLRRWLRERSALGAELDHDPVTRHAHPRWLIDAIARDWPAQADAILAANNEPAPLTLRVNRRRGDRDALRARFAEAGIEAEPHARLPHALILPHGGEVSRLPGYVEGWFSVQDGAAQRVADLLAPADGQRVLDACAAPGGKTAHLLECADIDLLAIDRDPARLPRLRENLERLGLDAQIRVADAARPDEWWDGRTFDRILLDAPCSASGILRRQPDVRLHRRASDIAALAAVQEELLHASWPLLAPGGRLVYASCSVLRAENEASVAGLLAARQDARALDVPDTFGHVAGAGRQRLPGEDGMDGFFYALLEKTG